MQLNIFICHSQRQMICRNIVCAEIEHPAGAVNGAGDSVRTHRDIRFGVRLSAMDEVVQFQAQIYRAGPSEITVGPKFDVIVAIDIVCLAAPLSHSHPDLR